MKFRKRQLRDFEKTRPANTINPIVDTLPILRIFFVGKENFPAFETKACYGHWNDYHQPKLLTWNVPGRLSALAGTVDNRHRSIYISFHRLPEMVFHLPWPGEWQRVLYIDRYIALSTTINLTTRCGYVNTIWHFCMGELMD